MNGFRRDGTARRVRRHPGGTAPRHRSFKETPMSLRLPVLRRPVVAGVGRAVTDLAATVVAVAGSAQETA
jgi:hypothetical protein